MPSVLVIGGGGRPGRSDAEGCRAGLPPGGYTLRDDREHLAGERPVPEQQQVLLPAYERAMFADLDGLLAAIPHLEVAVQWDVAVEFSILEEYFGPAGPQALDTITAALARCVDTVPADVPVDCTCATETTGTSISSSPSRWRYRSAC